MATDSCGKSRVWFTYACAQGQESTGRLVQPCCRGQSWPHEEVVGQSKVGRYQKCIEKAIESYDSRSAVIYV